MDKPPYQGPERRYPVLSEEELDLLAERVVERTLQKVTSKMYQEIGKNIISKLLTGVGIGVIGLYFYARDRGWVQ
ncbi:hypothetical protein ABO04_04940 [Nitrosomonas sp. HPC101]|uniref:hypothetical protein n=1 Tax=Nitrosomonas sp. HPC101 TaxID=1658667 RepID=UPI00136F960F|nr:hypothetical protein [Nitrosomonas sp. HPC101]MXS85280.1 hypothetical protein [Nitrosomonas sp. HPC101]